MSYDGEVKLIDFGIAKAAGKANKTQAGILKGKFGYMSPEQVRGNLSTVVRTSFPGNCSVRAAHTRAMFSGVDDFSTLKAEESRLPSPDPTQPRDSP